MPIEDTIVARIDDLITESVQLASGDEYNQVKSEQQRQKCAAWLVSATNVVQRLCAVPDNAYRRHADALMAQDHGYAINQAVGEMAALLMGLVFDAKAGLISSIADRARAEIFDDFLDHADSYATEGRKNEAGVISGVVFEDSLRRLCRKLGEPEKGIKLDDLISSLTKRGELTAIKAKRARVAAHVRTKASHAQWDEFELNDVRATTEFARELIASKLDA